MVIKGLIRFFLRKIGSIASWAEETQEKDFIRAIDEPLIPNKVKKIYSVWDFIRFKKDSQADHLSKVVGFDEWISMEEIRRRIKEVIGIGYLNERSLYPYIKTLVDVGLFEATNVGGIRKWKKSEFLFEIIEEKEDNNLKIAEKKKIKLISEIN